MPEPRTSRREGESPGYQLMILTLSIFAIAELAVRTTIKLDPAKLGVLQVADYAVCVVFFLDFLWSLWHAPSRGRYFLTWGWLDLLSSVPTIDVVRWGRAARVLRVFRVLRGIRASKLLSELILRRRAQNMFLAASVVALLFIVIASVAVLQFEAADPRSNIHTAGQAIWWSMATITTVAYGDFYPVTTEGRVVAGLLMCAGVALFGVFSGFLASWFLTGRSGEDLGMAEVRADIAALRRELARATEDARSGRAGG